MSKISGLRNWVWYLRTRQLVFEPGNRSKYNAILLSSNTGAVVSNFRMCDRIGTFALAAPYVGEDMLVVNDNTSKTSMITQQIGWSDQTARCQ
jgi:hypothetical protein